MQCVKVHAIAMICFAQTLFLNQAHDWFLKIVSVGTSVCVFVFVCVWYVCVSASKAILITSGVMWHEMDPYNWLNKFYSCIW